MYRALKQLTIEEYNEYLQRDDLLIEEMLGVLNYLINTAFILTVQKDSNNNIRITEITCKEINKKLVIDSFNKIKSKLNN